MRRTFADDAALVILAGAVLWAVLMCLFVFAVVYDRRHHQQTVTQPPPTTQDF